MNAFFSFPELNSYNANKILFAWMKDYREIYEALIGPFAQRKWKIFALDIHL